MIDGTAVDGIVDAIVLLLRRRTGVDFSAYRRTTIERRIHNRMLSLAMSGLPAYYALLESSDDETARLVERITIKVSRFYRNAATFDLLRATVMPALVERRAGQPLRVWSAGCGRGEEAYTLAMLLDERGAPGRVQATDIDASALEAARTGCYAPDSLVELPQELQTRYFDAVTDKRGGRYAVREILRSRVHCTLHDVMSGAAPPGEGRFDLVVCRNVLIYLGRDVQQQATAVLRAAVADGGFLCLGEAEWPPPAVAASLRPLGYQTRVFEATTRPRR